MDEKYREFLQSKIKIKIDSGFDIDESNLNKNLFDFQKFIVKKALKAGKYAIFADTGMGKTAMQLSWADAIRNKFNCNILILAPLAVSSQTINEGKKFGIDVVKIDQNYQLPNSGIYIINYEQIDNIDCGKFDAVVLDESSILKNYTGVYKNKIIKYFEKTKYKLACTATPSPNDINEIGNHSQFLDVLDSTDMRSRWFVRDEGMNNYRLKEHGKEEFYSWIGSWSTIIKNPSDIGFIEEGKKFNLPKLNYIKKEIQIENKSNLVLFSSSSVNATEFNSELRKTQSERLNAVFDIISQNKSESFIIWINQNSDGDELKKILKDFDFREIRGSDPIEKKEKDLIDFSNGKYKILITKSKIAGMGMNFQNCNNQIFAAMDFSFEKLYQSIRRSYRFGQKKDVNIYLITVDTMANVIESITKKENQFNELRNSIIKTLNSTSYGLNMDYQKKEIKNKEYHIINGDSIEEIDNFDDNSFDFSIFSPPFATLFTYSNSYRDLGNCDNKGEFFEQNRFLLKKLFNKIRPGRLVAVHTKDLAVYKNSSGYTGLYDFTGLYHREMELAGFKYHSKITIWTDPVLEMQRTKTQRLLYKQLRKDSTYTGVGLPEYLTIFKKWDGLNEPNEKPVNNKNKENFDLEKWQRWASPIWGDKLSISELRELIFLYSNQKEIDPTSDINVDTLSNCWFDILRTDVLNNKQGADQGDEKHICPLQLTIIRRAIQLWTNPGEIVFTPFMGIGSEVYESVKLNRIGIGIELKDSYFDVAKKNLESVLVKRNQLELFN